MTTEQQLELSIVMPCLNEAETIGACIEKAMRYLNQHHISGEVIVSDNGSTDGSIAIAERLGARVVHATEKGYGSALMYGIEAAFGKYVIMGDSDDSYDFSALNPFLIKLREGYDLVVGNRFKGGIGKGAMPFLHKYLGNPVLSFIGKLFFHSPVNDFHCGLRGFRQDIVSLLNLRTTGMEFASEMIVKASLFKLRICEVPTTLSVAGRSRPPHLRTWQDGWRHLRFLLIYSPRWLFLYPGILLMLTGMLSGGFIMNGPVHLFNIYFDTNTLLYSGAAAIIGFQLMVFGIFTRRYAIQTGLMPDQKTISLVEKWLTLERGIVVGVLITLAGVAGSAYSLYLWDQVDFGTLEYSSILRVVIPSVVFIILGIQTIFSSFFLSVLSLNRKR